MHRSSWRQTYRSDEVDKKGVAVALAFLVAVTMVAGGRGDQSADQRPGPKTPAAPAKVELHAASETAFEIDHAAPHRSLLGKSAPAVRDHLGER